MSLAELAEDEILLALPVIAVHSEGCPAGNSLARQAAQGEQPMAQSHRTDSLYNAPTAKQTNIKDEGKPHPFAALAELKEKLSK